MIWTGDYALADLPRLGGAVAAMLRAGDVVGLSGDLGAGKTTLARAVLTALGLAGEAPSPSFAIVQPYDDGALTLPMIHVDLYRLDGPQDMAELGLDDYRADCAMLVEWPERAGPGYWPDMLDLTITGGGARRRLTAVVPPAWEARWSL